MTISHVASISPNSPIGRHHSLAGNRKQPAIAQIVRQIDSQHIIGKRSVIDFLYQKHLSNCKPDTLSNYRISILPFLCFARTQGRNQLNQLTPADLEGFVEHQQDRGLKPSTIRLRLILIYGFLRYLMESNELPPDQFIHKIRIRIPDTLPKAMIANDVRRLMSVIDDIRNRAMILILLRTGMRIGELLRLKIYDIRFSERKAFIWEGEKNCIGRAVCISDDALQALIRWFDIRNPDIEHVFYSQGRRAMRYTTARAMFKKYLDQAGLACKNYGLHSLRHTFATDLLNAGMHLECLQQLLGHSSLEMTLRYARLTDQTREEEYFRAMARIEGGSSYEPDPLDCQLSPSS